MEHYLTPDEQAVYQLAHQVFQNHCTLHALTLVEAYTILVFWLADLCTQAIVAGVDETLLVRNLVDRLIWLVTQAPPDAVPDATLELASTDIPTDTPLDDEDVEDPCRDLTTDVLMAVSHVTADMINVHALGFEGSLRLQAVLLAEVLSLFAAEVDFDQEELTAFIQHTTAPYIQVCIRNVLTSQRRRGCP